MTVKELIEKLQDFDGDCKVIFYHPYFDRITDVNEVKSVYVGFKVDGDLRYTDAYSGFEAVELEVDQL